MLLRLLPITAAAVMLAACGGESSAPVEKATGVTNSASEKPVTANAKKLSAGKANIEFGNETLDGFSSIKCRARPEKSQFSVTASGGRAGARRLDAHLRQARRCSA